MAIFKKGYVGGRVELYFVDLEAPTPALTKAKERLTGFFDMMSRTAQAAVGDRASEDRDKPSEMIKRPRIAIKKLVVKATGS
jgi:hypothetical protein